MPSLIKFLAEYLKIIIWLIIAGFIMSWFFWRNCCTSISSYFWIGFFTSSLWILLWLGNAYISRVFDYFYSWYQEPLKRLALGIVGMIVYTVGSVYGLIYLFLYAFQFDVGTNLTGTFISTMGITLIITMFMTSRAFFKNWRQSAVDAERAKKESVVAQYESLKSQVNPHFLFNSLNALTNLVYEDQDKAVKFIKQLSEVYRYVLDTREKEVVPIDDELRFLESYFFLQKIRFGENLKVENQLRAGSTMLAPLALQLLVENAIKHNVVSADDPLTIKLYQEQGFVVVENSLQKKITLGEKSNGLGIDNIKRRYQFLTAKEVAVVETRGKFIVKLPIIEMEKV
jgi:sensor histidine kinase YesM